MKLMKLVIATGLVSAVTLGLLTLPVEAAGSGLSTRAEQMASLDWQERAPGAKMTRREAALAIQSAVGATDSPFDQTEPERFATRLETIVWLVQALGYESEAQAHMEADLPFADAGRIPAALVGYVAAAIDHQLIGGFADRTFRPDQPVKRVELAAILSQVEARPAPPAAPAGEFVIGEVIMVHPGSPTRVSLGRVVDGIYLMTAFELPAGAPVVEVGNTVRLTIENGAVTRCEIVNG